MVDTLMKFSLFVLMAMANLKSTQMILIVSIITVNLPMNPVERMSHFWI